jgi:undecaprenyl-diphosphatase
MNDTGKHAGELTLLVITHLLLSLVIFSSVIAVLVFLVRKPLRKYKPVDMAIFQKLQRLVNPQTDRFMLFITWLGKHQFLVPANLVLILFFLVIHKQSWFSVRVAAIALSSLVLMLLLKKLFRRKRPLAPLLQAVRGLSFPSGHAMMSVTFYGLIIYILSHTIQQAWLFIVLTILLVVLILLIGFSRVYLRVHYASDVTAGFIIGFCWLFISLGVIKKLEDYAISERIPVVSEIIISK